MRNFTICLALVFGFFGGHFAVLAQGSETSLAQEVTKSVVETYRSFETYEQMLTTIFVDAQKSELDFYRAKIGTEINSKPTKISLSGNEIRIDLNNQILRLQFVDLEKGRISINSKVVELTRKDYLGSLKKIEAAIGFKVSRQDFLSSLVVGRAFADPRLVAALVAVLVWCVWENGKISWQALTQFNAETNCHEAIQSLAAHKNQCSDGIVSKMKQLKEKVLVPDQTICSPFELAELRAHRLIGGTGLGSTSRNMACLNQVHFEECLQRLVKYCDIANSSNEKPQSFGPQ